MVGGPSMLLRRDPKSPSNAPPTRPPPLGTGSSSSLSSSSAESQPRVPRGRRGGRRAGPGLEGTSRDARVGGVGSTARARSLSRSRCASAASASVLMYLGTEVPSGWGRGHIGRPFCSVISFSDGMPPSTVISTPLALTASFNHVVCACPPTLFMMTAFTSRSRSKFWYPWMMAAALRARAQQSTTRMTGAPSHLAICAVLPSSDVPSRPSKRPIEPSMMAMSASSPRRATRSLTLSSSSIHPSMLVELLPVAASWCSVSRKSGPTLNPWTFKPRRLRAPMRAMLMTLLPTPEDTPPTTTTLTIASTVLLDSGAVAHAHFLGPHARGGIAAGP
mmetsp:Transcript_16379/g.51480  ORF Transcript_16379/g.51480 Transcript_16379/m.51480 type:complete len:333 (+) Transcript_16379:886-1884(+)